METVYKYCQTYGADILRNLEIKVTPPNKFNDQFEFTPKMICSDPVKWAKRSLTREHVQQTLYQMAGSSGEFSRRFPEFQEEVERSPAKWIEVLAKSAQDRVWLADEEMRFLDIVSDWWGVLCLSRRRDSVLMWGHYCDKPLGIVIGFDKSATMFQQAKAMRPVDYVKERVVFDTSWDRGSPELAAYEDRIIFSKSKEWCYELELRQAFQLRDLRSRPLGGTGAFGYFVPVQPDAIVSVTLGPRCSFEQESYVREILHYNPLLAGRHVTLDRACLDEDIFSLRFESIL